MKRLVLSIQFLTIFPVGKPGCPEPGELGRSMAFFPVVGVLLGVILVVADAILLKFLPVALTSAVLLCLLFFMSGGLHLDGFADTVDGIAGGATAKERLSIMRDSRVGAIGLASVVFLLLLKFLCIESLGTGVRGEALLLFPVAGRWAMAPMATWAGYAREEEGLGKAFAGIDNSTLVTSTALPVLIFVLFLGILGVFILAVLLVLTYAVTRYFKKRLGGVTGDVFGFLSDVSEGAFLLVVIGSSWGSS